MKAPFFSANNVVNRISVYFFLLKIFFLYQKRSQRSDWLVSPHERTTVGGWKGTSKHTHTPQTPPMWSAGRFRMLTNRVTRRPDAHLQTYGVSGSRSETARTNLSRHARRWPRLRPRTSYLSSSSLLLTYDLCLPPADREENLVDGENSRRASLPKTRTRTLPSVQTTLFTGRTHNDSDLSLEVFGRANSRENSLRCFVENAAASDCEKKANYKDGFRFSFDLCLVIVGLHNTFIIINTFR